MYNEEEIILKWMSEMYDENETDTYDVDFALSIIGDTPKRILEIACGSGRFLVPMAKAGHHLLGLDFDEYMLDKIAAKATDCQGITWRKSDVIHDEWGNGFDVVLLAANFLFNIVAEMDYEKAQELVIQKSADALLSGGHILIDYNYTFHPEWWFNNPNPKVIWEGKDSDGNFGKMTLLEHSYDETTGVVKFTRRFEFDLADGNSFVKNIPCEKHFLKLEQVKEWLLKYDFIIENEYGDYQGNPIDENTSKAIIWARKK